MNLYEGAVIVAYPGTGRYPPYFLKVVRTTKTLAIADDGTKFKKEYNGDLSRHPRQTGYWLTKYKLATQEEVDKAKKIQRAHRIVGAARALTIPDVQNMTEQDQAALGKLLL